MRTALRKSKPIVFNLIIHALSGGIAAPLFRFAQASAAKVSIRGLRMFQVIQSAAEASAWP
jgi:hypothetical protein